MPQQQARGRLKIYFGYAAGVGKRFQMLEDARQLELQGFDVLIETQGATSLDVAGVLARKPQICVVDDLARARQWEGVQRLLDAGIDVLSSMNVQELESLSDQVWQITGQRVRETVPDWVLQQADEVVMVDLTPLALIHRLERGAVFPAERAARELAGLYREPTLVALRELAIRQTAQALEARHRASERKERILVHVTSEPTSAMLLRRARRVADYLHADCLAVCVSPDADPACLPAVERHFRFAESLHIETCTVHGRDPARALIDYARKRGVTQLFIHRSPDTPRRWLPGLEFTDRVVQLAGDLEVTVVSERRRDGRLASPYPEDEAGGIMHSGYVAVSPDASVEEAIAYIRRKAEQIEMIYYAYVVDGLQHLLGVASFRELLSAGRTRKVRDVMRTDHVFVYEDDDKEDVAKTLARQRLLAVPVVDREGHMRGIVDSTQVVGVVQEEAGEDIQKIGGMEALTGPYLLVTFGQMVRKRAGWLAILFLGEMLTATAMGYYSDEISKAVVLALFLPLIISSGGNSGSQATTLVIRAMAMGELRLSDWFRVIRREVAAGIALGSILGVIGVSRILVWQAVRGSYGLHYVLIALTIGCSLVGVVLFGTIAGSMLPFVLRRLGLDPASASAPFVATLVDVTGLIIYFSVASFILHGTLL